MVSVNEEEIDRLDLNLTKFDGGATYIDPAHSYTSDLDIFGKQSIFQLLNRANTIEGKSRLASWLSQPQEESAILARQKSSQELSDKTDWTTSFLAHLKLGDHTTVDKSKLTQWLAGEEQVYGRKLYLVLSILGPLLGTLSVVLLSLSIIPYGVFGIWLLIGVGVVGLRFKYASETALLLTPSITLLKNYRKAILHLEQESFESAQLQKIQSNFKQQNFLASAAIERLEKHLDQFQNRSNILYISLNIVFFLDIILLYRMEKWRKQYRAKVAEWMDQIGEMEALVSLAFHRHTFPDTVYPSFVKVPKFEGVQLGHPLIPVAKRVSNDFNLGDTGRCYLITGSNMSGKTTFLRTLGVNMVLAQAGATVTAKSLELSKWTVFTSMRNQDDLSESVSSFYAELKRIKDLLGLLGQNPPVFYLLDEILKGTNSADRIKGSEALIKQLLKANASGCISTHDVELGNMASEWKGLINKSFNSDIKDDDILFDYQIKDGVCHSFNASKLMQLMGIKI